MPSPYFFFHPVLAPDLAWAAINWQSGSPDSAQQSDFVRCFSESGATILANVLPMIVNADPVWFELGTALDAFDARQAIFILPTPSLDNAQTMERCKHLHAEGYRFGLHIDKPGIFRRVPLAVFEFLSFDSAYVHQEIDASDLAYSHEAGLGMIATNVGSYEMFNWLAEKQFDLVDSHFLTTRNPKHGKEPDLTRLKLLKLLNLVKADGDTHQIEAIFREEPKLSYNLLRLVNSVAVGARTKISNFSQAIAILGRRQLQRWLQLLIYANNLADGNAPNPLMQLAAARGHQLELLCAQIEPKLNIPDLKDNAFLTGLFSLLDVLINLPMNEILKELPMHEDVVEALISPGHGGVLSQLLSVVTAGETGHFSSAQTILSRLDITPAAFAKAQVDSYYWASRINIDHHD